MSGFSTFWTILDRHKVVFILSRRICSSISSLQAQHKTADNSSLLNLAAHHFIKILFIEKLGEENLPRSTVQHFRKPGERNC
jgi:hypothetical protein